MKIQMVLLCSMLSLVFFSGFVQANEKSPKMVLGWLESTRLMSSGMRIKTKLDPGAKTSSIQATNLKYITRGKDTYVAFDFTDENLDTGKSETHRLEGKLMREVVIKRHGAKNVTRPVVAMEFCLYHQVYKAEFSLANRGKFNYSILLGRSFLSKVALVDSSEIFLSKPYCEGNSFIQDALE
ncbi:ATP-dependent zinc protease family protein [Simiduia curdlanivorans]